MSDKMWAGRFSAETDKRVNDFNSSIRFDCRMYEEDITGSIVHARMLARQGIISAAGAALSDDEPDANADKNAA